MPEVSIIIPCYNQGHYLHESVGSTLAQTFEDIEIIVVDDGSTDPDTCRILTELMHPRVTVLHKPNGGLASARNYGINAAKGRYILPLDCDDRIAPDYIRQAVAKLDQDPDCGIVYCQAEKFGSESGPWKLSAFSHWRMCLGNVIFCSALYRRSDWEAAGGYDETLRRGWEDWDFWLSILELGRTVHCLPMVGFFYRKNEASMAAVMKAELKAQLHRRIIEKHPSYFGVFASIPQMMLKLYYLVAANFIYRDIKRGLGR
ncbi:MAG TPA: glycosyltransferase family A protein [Deltaproteobacteria bacterium]|nr:glycosyltransferase family A protein [Deltaproteobacteria bacterium]HQB38638.1 glycosyltransferase family A protein [Deltaproteobacteria bacterium]